MQKFHHMHQKVYKFAVVILCLSSPMTAQVISHAQHALSCLDSFNVYQQPYYEMTDSGEHCIWDFSHIPNDTLATYVSYYSLSNDSTLIGKHFAHTNYFFKRTNDTLYAVGYENTQSSVRFSSPIVIMKYPFSLHDSLYSQYQGYGEHNHLSPIELTGNYKIKCDAIGKILLPDMTIENVLRIHSLSSFCDVSNLQEKAIIEEYEWYAEKYAHSIFKTTKIHSIKGTDTSIVQMAYYNPQEEINITKDTTSIESVSASHQDIITNIVSSPNPVVSTLTISYSLSQDANTYFSLYYAGSTEMYATPLQWQTLGEHTKLINMSSFPTGNYVLYIHADDTIIAKPIVKF